MSRSTRRKLVLVLAVLVTVSACGGGDDESLDRIPLLTLTGETTSLSDVRTDAPLVVALWAVWCQPCRRELPELQAIDASDRNVDVVAVNIGDDVDAIEVFTDELGLEIPVLRDEDGDLLSALGVPSVPATYVIGPDGVVSWQHIGAVDEGQVARVLDELVAG